MQEKKKLAIFITRMVRGGAQKIVLDLLLNLDRTKYEITLITGKTPETESNYIDSIPSDVNIIRCDYVVREIFPLQDFFALFKLKKLFQKEKFDILHLHTSKAGVLGSIAGRWAGIKRIVYTPHGHIFGKNAAIPGFSEISPWKKNLLFHLRRYAYKKCDRLVALSDEDLKEQVDLKLAGVDKFVVIMNGIDFEYYSAKVFSELDVKGRIIGSVGRLSREKGHDILINAFVQVLKKIPEAKLLIVGDGPEKKNLAELAEKLKVSDNVLFPGMVDDVRGFLQKMEVFVLPSRYESQGIAVMEAMASGVPVVAAEVGGVPGIITNKENGLLFKSEDPSALCECILKLLGNNSVKVKLVENALKRVESECDIKKMIQSYENLYNDKLQDYAMPKLKKVIILTPYLHFHSPVVLKKLFESASETNIEYNVILTPKLSSKKGKIASLKKIINDSGWNYLLYMILLKIKFDLCHFYEKIFLISPKKRQYSTPLEICKFYKQDFKIFRDINSDKALSYIKNFSPDFIISIFFNQILKNDILGIPKNTPLNIHPSLLPRYKGMSPVLWMLSDCEVVGGVTLHYMDEKIDNGNIVSQSEFNIERNDSFFTVYRKAAENGGNLIAAFLKEGEPFPFGEPQHSEEIPVCGPIKRLPFSKVIKNYSWFKFS